MGEPQTPHFYDFGILGRVAEPQIQYDLFLKTQDTFKKSKKAPKLFLENIIWGNVNVLGSPNLGCCWKRRTSGNPDDPFNKLLKILEMGSISFRKHEIGIWLATLKL